MKFEILVSLRGNFAFSAETESPQMLKKAHDIIAAGLVSCDLDSRAELMCRRVENTIVPLRWNPESNLFEEE